MIIAQVLLQEQLKIMSLLVNQYLSIASSVKLMYIIQYVMAIDIYRVIIFTVSFILFFLKNIFH